MRMRRLSWALLLAGAVQAQNDPATLAQSAVALQQQGQYREAAQQYASLEKLVPSDVATHVNYGVVLVHLSRYQDAIKEYEAAEKLLPNDPRIELNLALAYEKSGDRKEAQARFEALHAAAPDNAQVTMLLADSYLSAQDYPHVIALLQPLKDSPDLGVAYMMATALLRTQHSTEAQAYVDRVAGNGDSAEARFLLGIQAYESGNYPDSVKQLQSAADKNPALPGLEAMLGRSLLFTGDPDAALTAFDAALKTDANDIRSVIAKAQILTARKDDTKALPLAQRALRMDPDNPRAQLTMAELLVRGHAFAQARGYAEKAVAAMPKDEDAHRILASVYRAQHLQAKAMSEDAAADELAAAGDPGPRTNEAAPDFTLADAVSGKPVSLADYRGKSPVTLIFGSYSCPNFRDSAETLKALQKRYGSRVPFLLIYVREAHAQGQWQSGRNAREDIALAPAATMSEKEEHASMCSRKLHLPFPALVDGMDGKVEAEYNAWPSRAYVVAKDGRVAYSTRLSELDFQPERMEAVLRKLSNE